MSVAIHFRQFFYFLGLCAVAAAGTLTALPEYKYGTFSYYSDEPVTINDHLESMAEGLSRDIFQLIEYDWVGQTKMEELRHLALADEEYEPLKSWIVEGYQQLKQGLNNHYKSTHVNIFEYVDSSRMPKDLAWQFGLLFGFYADFQHKITFCNQESFFATNCFDFYKTSLLFFTYYFGLSDRSPSVLQHVNLHEFASDPEYSSELDQLFQKEFSLVDEMAWLQALQKLDQQRLQHICTLFRSFYRLIMQNRESLPKSYLCLAAHLCSLNAKMLLPAQKNVDYHLDAINPWMYKLYIDFKQWEVLQKEGQAFGPQELHVLLPELQNRCLQLLPTVFTLEEIVEKNEFAICEQVRMRNLLPSNPKNQEKGEKIIDEFEFSPFTMRKTFTGVLNFFENRAGFAQGKHVAIDRWKFVFGPLSAKAQQIYNYLSGYVEMSDLPLSQDNALEYLLEVKLFDRMAEVWNSNAHIEYEYVFHFGYIGFGQFYFPRTTFELRKKILKLCPHLKSYEAFTVSVNPEKVRQEKNEVTPGAWIDESEQIRHMCIEDLLQKAYALSDMMNTSPLKGVIVGTRGISGAGKSTFLKRNILPLVIPEGLEAQQIDFLTNGILDPDIIKAAIRKFQGGTLNRQTHEEGINAYKQVFREIASRGPFILDRRLLYPYEIISNLVNPARKGNRSVWLFDFDISLTTCLLRILTRTPQGNDSCPEYEALIDGIQEAKRYRAKVVEFALREEIIAQYELYATSKQQLVAHKVNGEACPFDSGCANSLCIHDSQLFEQCCHEPTYEELGKELSQVIDDTFIAEAISRGDIAPDQRKEVEKWSGMTLKEAVQQHVQGVKGTSDAVLFEPPVFLPFNGNEWLADLPHLITFLQSEHILHIRGVDETGRGLHWEEAQDTGINPKYLPDTKVANSVHGGFQIKLGYFIVPMDNLDLHLSDKLSPAIVRELTVRNDDGQLIGLRFFVHPEAYAHFAPLLRANIPFVPPSESEFMGTPTASYDAWLIRRITESDRMPFIVKMGTPNGLGDIMHLLAGDDIVRSLSIQKRLDLLPDRPNFLFFNETAGLILKNIHGYPVNSVDSGILVCELPEQFLTGECKLVSLSALMSGERIRPENRGIAALIDNQSEMQQLPLIYELMETAIQNEFCKNSAEFLQKTFIDAYFKALEPFVLQEENALQAEGKNLYLVLNHDNTMRGFAYRGIENMASEGGVLKSSYHANFIKLLNVITRSDSDETSALPTHADSSYERNLYPYLCKKMAEEGAHKSVEILQKLSITTEERAKLLMHTDASKSRL